MYVKGVICFRGGFALVLWTLQSFSFNRSPVSSEKSERRVGEACGELLHFFFCWGEWNGPKFKPVGGFGTLSE